MRVSLRVGVCDGTSGVMRALLESLGALVADMRSAPLDPGAAACVATTSPWGYPEYVRAGGVLLAPEDCWPRPAESLGEVCTPFSGDDLGWSGLSADGECAAPRLCFRLARFGAGYCVEVPRRLLDQCWTSRDLGMKHFYCGSGVDVQGTTSAYDKANIQKTLLWALQKCYALRRLPCLTKDRVPAGASNVFCFRLDCDGGPRKDFQNALDALAHDVPHLTYFLNVFEYELRPEDVRAITRRGGGGESHGYLHIVFSHPDVERRNLARAHDWIARRSDTSAPTSATTRKSSARWRRWATGTTAASGSITTSFRTAS